MSSVFVKNQPGETFKLNNIDYFYDHIRREFCDEILTNDGDFLVRKGHHGSETDLVISVRVLGEVKHCKPNRKENGEYYFCYDDTTSSQLSELISTHYTNKLPIGREGNVKIMLVRPVSCPSWIFHPQQIEIKECIGHGSISDVYHGILKTTGGSEDVALKVLKVQDQSSCNDLLSEARVLRYLKHPNLVGWKGIVIKRDQMMLVLEYVNCGSLHATLSKLSIRGKIKALLEVAKALQYLHSEHVFHRNIAARNILIKYEKEIMVTKLSDLCLCRGGGANSRYTMESPHSVPAAWTAPESLVTKEWTTASDVWSYGVLIWEVFNEDEMPYKSVLNEVNIENLKHYLLVLKKRLPPSKLMPSELVDMMNRCFNEDPKCRPTINDIINPLQKMYDTLRNVN